MEQRRLRLGDILDDYCPRERRVTNHAVVAMIEEDIKQTRCTTCDAEHAYKGGKAPRKRKKETPSALYKEVLAGIAEDAQPVLTNGQASIGKSSDSLRESETSLNSSSPARDDEAPAPAAIGMPAVSDHTEDGEAETASGDEGPVHRRLIRATLPRPEGQKDARPAPEFTVRHSGNRPGNGSFREGRIKGRGPGGPPRPQGGQRFAGARGNGRGAGGSFRPSQAPRHGGKKRSR